MVPLIIFAELHVSVCVRVSLIPSLSQSSLCEPALKPGSHRKIVKDYRSKTSKDQEILSESG